MRRTALMLVLTLALGIAVAVIGEQSLNAQQVSDPRVADLVRAGRVRVGLALLPTFATKDPVTGELRGVAIDLAARSQRASGLRSCRSNIQAWLGSSKASRTARGTWRF